MESTPISSLPEAVSVGSSDLMVILQDGVTKKANAQALAATVPLAWVDITGKPTEFTPEAHTHVIGDITDFTDNSGNWNTAFGWGDHSVAGYLTSVAWGDVTGKPTFATVATTGAYSDLSGLPTLGTAAATASTDYATAAQGTTADNALARAGGTMTGLLTLDSLKEQTTALATSGTVDINSGNGGIQYHTYTAAVTYTDGLANGESVALHFDDGTGFSPTWPTITWLTADSTAPAVNDTGYNVIVLSKFNSVLYGYPVRVG